MIYANVCKIYLKKSFSSYSKYVLLSFFFIFLINCVLRLKKTPEIPFLRRQVFIEIFQYLENEVTAIEKRTYSTSDTKDRGYFSHTVILLENIFHLLKGHICLGNVLVTFYIVVRTKPINRLYFAAISKVTNWSW